MPDKICISTTKGPPKPIEWEGDQDASLSILFGRIRDATNGVGGDNVAKLWGRINEGFSTENGRPDVLKKSVPRAPSEHFWDFSLEGVGTGKLAIGLSHLSGEDFDDKAPIFEQCYIYVSLFLKPEGWNFPILGNHHSKADRLAKKTLQLLENKFEMPLAARSGGAPWLWDDEHCSYSLDKRRNDAILISAVSSHNAPGYRNPITGGHDPSFWD